MKEIWKPIPGYENDYEVSNLGNVKTLKYNKQHLLKPSTLKRGYQVVALYKNSKRKWFLIHRIVWIAFNGPIPKEYEINHKDENKLNNSLHNLELITPSENVNYGTRNERVRQKLNKRVQMLDNNGNIIKTFCSIKEASEYLGKKYCTHIGQCCQGKLKKACGYVWKYVD